MLHELSFDDDPTRAIRAARFAARFGLTLTDDTRALLDSALRRDAFSRLSTDRLGAELDRLLREPAPGEALRRLRAWGLMPVLHPSWQLSASLLDRLAQFVQAAREPSTSADFDEGPLQLQADGGWTVLAGGLPPADRPQASALIPGPKARRARFIAGPEAVDCALAALTRGARPSAVAHALTPLDPVQLQLAQAWSQHTSTPGATRSHLDWWRDTGRHIRTAVDGRWLAQQGYPPGPRFALALRAALDVARDGGSVSEQRASACERLAQSSAGPALQD